ncbi:hypothetical protein NDU88_001601 [Pleurodeles waltl]|uniref:Uncharacterized protein n=1 Tax=Pleurodeles waltl TaxID=8319 RepID=A0AAV7WM88_PLEWA|nr:hypothetical protein NDU88_001601 [Pleurodeles waltl]
MRVAQSVDLVGFVLRDPTLLSVPDRTREGTGHTLKRQLDRAEAPEDQGTPNKKLNPPLRPVEAGASSGHRTPSAIENLRGKLTKRQEPKHQGCRSNKKLPAQPNLRSPTQESQRTK